MDGHDQLIYIHSGRLFNVSAIDVQSQAMGADWVSGFGCPTGIDSGTRGGFPLLHLVKLDWLDY